MLLPKRILSPIDFSEDSLGAFDVAQDVATRYGSELMLVHAVSVRPKLPADISIFRGGQYEQELIKDAEGRLEELAQKARAKGLQVRTAVGLANDTAMEILRTADQEEVDLIVIAPHGMTGWRRLAFGSVTDKVVRTADCPVLVLRKNAAEHSEKATSASA